MEITEEIRKQAERLLELETSMAPAPWCKDYAYSAVRHVERNCGIDCGVHGDYGSDPGECPGAFARYDGTALAEIRNMLHPFLIAILGHVQS